MSMIPQAGMGSPGAMGATGQSQGQGGMPMAPSMSGHMPFSRSLFGGVGRGIRPPPNPAAHPQLPQAQPATADVVGQMAQQAHQQNANAKIASFKARFDLREFLQLASSTAVKTAYEQYVAGNDAAGSNKAAKSQFDDTNTHPSSLSKRGGDNVATSWLLPASPRQTAALGFHGNVPMLGGFGTAGLTKVSYDQPMPSQPLPADPAMGAMSTAISAPPPQAPPAAPMAGAPAPVPAAPPMAPPPAAGAMPPAGPVPPGALPQPGMQPQQPGVTANPAVQQSMQELMTDVNSPAMAGEDMKFQGIVQASDVWGLGKFAAAPRSKSELLQRMYARRGEDQDGKPLLKTSIEKDAKDALAGTRLAWFLDNSPYKLAGGANGALDPFRGQWLDANTGQRMAGTEYPVKQAAPLFDVQGDLDAMDKAPPQNPVVKQPPAVQARPPVTQPATRPAAPAPRPVQPAPALRTPPGPSRGLPTRPGASGGLPGGVPAPAQARPMPVQPGMGRAQAAPAVPARPPVTQPATRPSVPPGSGMINGRPASEVLQAIRSKQGSASPDEVAALFGLERLFGKRAWQNNSGERTSASTESKNIGFGHKDDDYDRGPKAWETSAKYLKNGGGKDNRIPSSSTTKVASAFGQDSAAGNRLAKLVRKVLSRRESSRGQTSKVQKTAALIDEAKRQGMWGSGAQNTAPKVQQPAQANANVTGARNLMQTPTFGGQGKAAALKLAAISPGLGRRLRQLKAQKTIQRYQPAKDSVPSGDSENDTKV